MAPRVLISDKLSETAVQIFRDRGLDVFTDRICELDHRAPEQFVQPLRDRIQSQDTETIPFGVAQASEQPSTWMEAANLGSSVAAWSPA